MSEFLRGRLEQWFGRKKKDSRPTDTEPIKKEPSQAEMAQAKLSEAQREVITLRAEIELAQQELDNSGKEEDAINVRELHGKLNQSGLRLIDAELAYIDETVKQQPERANEFSSAIERLRNEKNQLEANPTITRESLLPPKPKKTPGQLMEAAMEEMIKEEGKAAAIARQKEIIANSKTSDDVPQFPEAA